MAKKTYLLNHAEWIVMIDDVEFASFKFLKLKYTRGGSYQKSNSVIL